MARFLFMVITKPMPMMRWGMREVLLVGMKADERLQVPPRKRYGSAESNMFSKIGESGWLEVVPR